MNLDELKIIFEALQHTADVAKDFGLWWIVLHYGVKVLHLLCLVADDGHCLVGAVGDKLKEKNT